MALLADSLPFHGGWAASPTKYVFLPRGSSSESETAELGLSGYGLELQAHATAHAQLQQRQELSKASQGHASDPLDCPHALPALESVHDVLEAVQAHEGLLGLSSEAQQQAAHASLEAIARLAQSQTFQLDARTAVEAWLSSTCKDLPAASAGHLRDLTAGIRVEDHRSAAVDMAGPAGGTVGHAHAAFSFYHAFDCHDFRGADDVCSPAWVTVELRCHADFKYASAADVASPPSDHLTLGIDVEWQAQPLGPATGRHPTVGAKSIPEFLVAHSCQDGSDAKNKAPCADQLARLQALLGLAQLPGRTFLSFLLLVGLAPHSGSAVGDGGDGGSAARPADAKRRRVATDAAVDAANAGAPQLWGRAAALLDSALSS